MLRLAWALLFAATVAAVTPLAGAGCDVADFDGALTRFSKALTFETVSDQNATHHALHPEEFAKLDAHLRSSFPSVFASLTVEKVGSGSLSYLFTWSGKDASLKPVLFISHVDVVPVDPVTLQNWTHPPFSGAIADGYVWGRGSLDVKVTAMALLEAVSALLQQGWAPTRTLMFAFGQDEEVGGQLGAAQTASLLESRGVELEVVWDEGSGVMVEGFAPLTHKPFAIVSTAEKGYLTAELHINSGGGHSSMPPIDGSSVGAVAGRLLSAMELHPPPPRLQAPTTDLLKGLAPLAPAYLQPLLAAANVPGINYLLARLLVRASRETAAMVRTTVVTTRMQAGVADNVLPQTGTISVNLRLAPGDSAESARRYLESLISSRDRPHVDVVFKGDIAAPSEVTPAKGRLFQVLRQAIQDVYKYDGRPVPVLPFQLTGMTDSKAYRVLSNGNILRFGGYEMDKSDIKAIHSVNEKISTARYCKTVCVFRRGIQLFGAMLADGPSSSSDPAQQDSDSSSNFREL